MDFPYNIFGSLKTIRWNKVIISAFSLILISIISAALGFLYAKYTYVPFSELDKIRSISNSVDPSPTISLTPSIDKYADWNTYSDPNYGITFKYPQDWVVTTKSYGDGLDNKDKFDCGAIRLYLKNPNSCVSPMSAYSIIVSPIKASADSSYPTSMEFSGPLLNSQACPIDNCKSIDKNIIVNSVNFTIPHIFHYTDTNLYTMVGFNLNLTSGSSIWQKFNVNFNTTKADSYDMFFKIIESIKPN